VRPPVVAAILIVVTGLLAMPPTFARDSPAPAAAGAWTVEPVAYFGGSAPPDLALDYEHSLRPELILHTDVQDVWRAVEDVVRLVYRLRHREAP